MTTRTRTKSYLYHGLLFASTVLVLTTYILWEFYDTQKKQIERILRNDHHTIEGFLTENFDKSSYITETLLQQILSNSDDHHYIQKIFHQYVTNNSIADLLTWTRFSWLDNSGYVKVDMMNGILHKRFDDSDTDFFNNLKANPGNFLINHEYQSLRTGRLVIPAGIGALDENGRFIGALVLGYDIDKLREKIKEILNGSPTDFALIDQDNKVILKSLDFDESSLQNLDDTNQIDKYNIDIFFKNLSSYFAKIDTYPFTLVINYRSEKIKDYLFEKFTSRLFEIIVITSISILLVFIVYRRETKLKNEAIAAKIKAEKAHMHKNDFLAFTAHELRSPLSYIITASELLLKEPFGQINDNYKEYFAGINQNSNELLVFICDLLECIKNQEANFIIRKENCNVFDLVQRAIKLNYTNIRKNKIKLETFIPQDLPNIHIDGRKTVQILNNIISNSIKYSHQQSTIKIEVKLVGKNIEISLSDNGIGMNEKQLKIAMQKYGTVRNVNSDKVDSTGLGLPLAKKLTEVLTGVFEITSQQNVGTKITLTFPLK